MNIRVHIADDHDIVRVGVKSVINKYAAVEIAGESKNEQNLLDFAENNKADVYILDIYSHGLNGVHTVSRLLKADPESKVIVLTVNKDKRSVLKAFKAGCKGYVTKLNAAREIIEALNKVKSGGYFISGEISDYLFDFNSDDGDEIKFEETGQLSSKETEVLKLIAEGKSSRDISEILGISPNTVNVHRNNIMHKLDLHKTAGLVRYAIREKLVTL